MKEKSDIFERFRNSFTNMQGHFHILEQQVPVERQMEYFKYLDQLRKEKRGLTDEEYQMYITNLSDEETTTERKKYILSALATSGEVRAFRILEKYAENPDTDVTDWAYMALMEIRIRLESELSEEKQIYVSTGLGGKGEKLRFYVLLLASENKPFEKYQRQVIEREFEYALPKEDCEIEKLNIQDVYVELVFLIPVRSNLKAILDNIIFECNQYGDFLSKLFTATNVKELSQQEVDEILEKKYGNSKTSD
ncbi:MAG: hypothetical protein LIP01_09805 [Tannerellaceae bacterium]|nr:hypothetical protein [Tannerellaceae bacterium]